MNFFLFVLLFYFYFIFLCPFCFVSCFVLNIMNIARRCCLIMIFFFNIVLMTKVNKKTVFYSWEADKFTNPISTFFRKFPCNLLYIFFFLRKILKMCSFLRFFDFFYISAFILFLILTVLSKDSNYLCSYIQEWY